jgi:hypothetical protein
MIDLIALAAVDQETEMTYIRRERDWAERAAAEGRPVAPTRLLPMLPSSVAAYVAKGLPAGNGHTNGNGHVPALTAGPGAAAPGAAGDHAGHGHG